MLHLWPSKIWATKCMKKNRKQKWRRRWHDPISANPKKHTFSDETQTKSNTWTGSKRVALAALMSLPSFSLRQKPSLLLLKSCIWLWDTHRQMPTKHNGYILLNKKEWRRHTINNYNKQQWIINLWFWQVASGKRRERMNE